MIVLDTCCVIWDALEPQKLSGKAKQEIEHADAENQLIVCDISFWEISMLVRRGRLQLDVPASDFLALFLESRNAQVAAISPEIAELSVEFGDEINNDPADRLIAATSVIKKAKLLTPDKNLRAAKILDTVW